MTPFRKKAVPFTFGLLLGIMIAGTFFILRLDNYFRELNFYKNFTKTYLSIQSGNPLQQKRNPAISPSKLIHKKQKSDEQTVQIKNDFKTDSLIITDSVSMKVPSVADNIVIRKDELLGVKTLELKDLNPLFHKTYKDSLLEKISEVKDDRQMLKKQLMNVEFWKSPLNYKGYKLSKNNVILYGLTDTQNVSIYMIENTIYMRHASIVYKLEYSNYFKPFDHIVEDQFSRNINNK